MRQALAIRDFRWLFVGQFLSTGGDWLLVVAVPVHVYAVTHSAAATAFVYAAQNLPSLVVGPWAGALSDRWERRTTMLVVDVSRAVLFVGLAACTAPTTVALFCGGIVAERVLGQLFDPSAQALLPNLVGTGEELLGANAAFGAAAGLVRLVGGPVGGILLITLGLRVLHSGWPSIWPVRPQPASAEPYCSSTPPPSPNDEPPTSPERG
jgi:MFS family permease